jgi:hypothetical protein
MAETSKQSPRILSIGWGTMEVESLGRGRDFKLWPGGGRPWDWRETGTAHTPGIQVEDVAELAERGCTTVVLSRGVFKRLKVSEPARTYLEQHGIETLTADTKEAVKLYNDCIDKNISVGGLFHTTC